MAGSQNEQEGESQVQQYEEGQSAAQQAGDLPIKEGAVLGAIAAIATYVLHLLLTVVATAQASPVSYTDDGSVVVTDMVATWKTAGWSYLSTFGVGFEADGEAATLSDAPNQAAAFGSIPFSLSSLVLFVASVGVIAAAGYAIAQRTDAEDAVESVKAGLTIVPAYLVVAVVIAVVMSQTFEDQALVGAVVDSVNALEMETYTNDSGEITDSVEFGASMSGAAIYAGILFPAVFAAAGAVLTNWQDAVDKIFAKVA